jgi:hypothetical protein
MMEPTYPASDRVGLWAGTMPKFASRIKAIPLVSRRIEQGRKAILVKRGRLLGTWGSGGNVDILHAKGSFEQNQFAGIVSFDRVTDELQPVPNQKQAREPIEPTRAGESNRNDGHRDPHHVKPKAGFVLVPEHPVMKDSHAPNLLKLRTTR